MATNRWLTSAAVALAFPTGLSAGGVVTGQGAVLRNTELRKIVAAAHTATQHRRLAARYHMRAATLDAAAKAHQAVANVAGQQESDLWIWLATPRTTLNRLATQPSAMDLANLYEVMLTGSER